jgi:hypothetical protein
MEQVSNQNAPVAYEAQTPVSVDMDAKEFSALVEASAKLKDKKPIITLTAEYIELAKPGESFRGIFFGLQEMQVTDQGTGELKTIQAARFLIDKGVKINGGVVLVNEIKRSGIGSGAPIEVTFKEKKGNTKIYTITLLQ